MKTTLGYVAFAILALGFLNGNRMLTHRAIAADRAEAQENLSGFAGFGFGSGDLYVIEQLRGVGQEPTEITDRAVWYEGTLWGYTADYGYVFTDGRLVGGAVLFWNRTEEAFLEVDEKLREIYGGKIHLTVEGQLTVQAHQGPDALILHTFDRESGEHEISYMEI